MSNMQIIFQPYLFLKLKIKKGSLTCIMIKQINTQKIKMLLRVCIITSLPPPPSEVYGIKVFGDNRHTSFNLFFMSTYLSFLLG